MRRMEVTMDKLLLKACQNGQKGVVMAFLKKDGVNVNAVDEIGFSPLHYVCKKGYRDIVKLLLDKEADVNLISNQSITPLHMAAVSGNKEIVKLLTDAGADLNATDKEGKTPLIYAVEAKKAECARFFVESGADTTIMDNQNHTALDYANALGMVQLIESIAKDNSGNADAFGNTPLHQACHNGQGEVVKTMLAKGEMDINARNDDKETPLFLAVAENNILIAELLLEAGADANIPGGRGSNSPLHIAAANENEHLVKSLLSHGANIDERNEDGETALIIAAIKGNNYIVGVLLDKGANFTYADQDEHTALYYAAEGGYNDITEKLLIAGAEN